MESHYREVLIDNDKGDDAYGVAAPLLHEALMLIAHAQTLNISLHRTIHVEYLQELLNTKSLHTFSEEDALKRFTAELIPFVPLLDVVQNLFMQVNEQTKYRNGNNSISAQEGANNASSYNNNNNNTNDCNTSCSHPYEYVVGEVRSNPFLVCPAKLYLEKKCEYSSHTRELLLNQMCFSYSTFRRIFNRLMQICVDGRLFTACDPRLHVLRSRFALYRAYNSAIEDAVHSVSSISNDTETEFESMHLIKAPIMDLRRLETCMSANAFISFIHELHHQQPNYLVKRHYSNVNTNSSSSFAQEFHATTRTRTSNCKELNSSSQPRVQCDCSTNDNNISNSKRRKSNNSKNKWQSENNVVHDYNNNNNDDNDGGVNDGECDEITITEALKRFFGYEIKCCNYQLSPNALGLQVNYASQNTQWMSLPFITGVLPFDAHTATTSNNKVVACNNNNDSWKRQKEKSYQQTSMIYPFAEARPHSLQGNASNNEVKELLMYFLHLRGGNNGDLLAQLVIPVIKRAIHSNAQNVEILELQLTISGCVEGELTEIAEWCAKYDLYSICPSLQFSVCVTQDAFTDICNSNYNSNNDNKSPQTTQDMHVSSYTWEVIPNDHYNSNNNSLDKNGNNNNFSTNRSCYSHGTTRYAHNLTHVLHNVFSPMWCALCHPTEYTALALLLSRISSIGVEFNHAADVQELPATISCTSSSLWSSSLSSSSWEEQQQHSSNHTTKHGTNNQKINTVHDAKNKEQNICEYTCNGPAPPNAIFAYSIWSNVQIINCMLHTHRLQRKFVSPPAPAPPPAPLQQQENYLDSNAAEAHHNTKKSECDEFLLLLPEREQPIHFRIHGSSDSRSLLVESVLGLLLADDIVNPTYVFQWSPLQYLYYLTQRHIILTPSRNRVSSFAVRSTLTQAISTMVEIGLHASIATLDPLFYHTTDNAMEEEVMDLVKYYGLSQTDVAEMSLHALEVQASFLHPVQRFYLFGNAWWRANAESNNATFTHVNSLRLHHRECAWTHEMRLLHSSTEHILEHNVPNVNAHNREGTMPWLYLTKEFTHVPLTREKRNNNNNNNNDYHYLAKVNVNPNKKNNIHKEHNSMIATNCETDSVNNIVNMKHLLLSHFYNLPELNNNYDRACYKSNTNLYSSSSPSSPSSSSFSTFTSASASEFRLLSSSHREELTENVMHFPRIIIAGPRSHSPSNAARALIKVLLRRQHYLHYSMFAILTEQTSTSCCPTDTQLKHDLHEEEHCCAEHNVHELCRMLLPNAFKLVNGVYEVDWCISSEQPTNKQTETTTTTAATSNVVHVNDKTNAYFEPLPRWEVFQSDVRELRRLANASPEVNDYATRRLGMLECKYWLHVALTNDDEKSYAVDSNVVLMSQHTTPESMPYSKGEKTRIILSPTESAIKGDLYNCVKVDVHCHMAGGMTAKRLSNFMKRKLHSNPHDVVDLDKRTKQPITLAELFHKVLTRAKQTSRLDAKTKACSALTSNSQNNTSYHGHKSVTQTNVNKVFHNEQNGNITTTNTTVNNKSVLDHLVSPSFQQISESSNNNNNNNKAALLNLDAVSIGALNVQAGNRTFNRFDEFNNRYSPMRVSALRSLFLKTDNFMGGRYFAELIHETFNKQQEDGNSFSEYRLSIYGRERNEWDKLSQWFVLHGMSHSTNQWMIQIPRLFHLYKRNNVLHSFQEMLTNIFAPLWEASVHPENHSFLNYFLANVSGFDSVDNESEREGDELVFVAPEEWTRETNPPFAYYMYYMWANITSLNRYRAARGLNTFHFRPHAGESGDPDHMADVFYIAHGVNHGIALAQRPVLQYLYYLTQIPLAIVPLSNNALFCKYEHNPFPLFFRRGLAVALATDGALMFHHTEEPLIEEYSTAQNFWGMSRCDMCEIAKNSVLMSGFPVNVKQKWLGPLYRLRSVVGNDELLSHVPMTRCAFRYEVYQEEVAYLEERATVSLSNRFMRTPLEEDLYTMELLGLSREEVLHRRFAHESLMCNANGAEHTNDNNIATSRNNTTNKYNVVQIIDGNDIESTPAFTSKTHNRQNNNNNSLTNNTQQTLPHVQLSNAKL